MIREPVISDNIHSVGHDAENEILEVQFHDGGRVYHYHGVSAETHKALMAASSKGRYLHQNIKGTYREERVE